MLILEPYWVTLEPWREIMEHRKLFLEAHPGAIKAPSETLEPHFEAVKAHFYKLLHILEPFSVTLEH